MSEWMPIETAPRDGTKFDAWQRERVINVFWSAVQEGWCVEGDYDPEEPTPLPFPEPTHWMPLPEPPVQP